jgi:hypothetical protein
MPNLFGYFSMKTFMEKVKQANWHFSPRKSKLWNLIEALGGEYDSRMTEITGGQGFGEYTYCFKRPMGTVYYSKVNLELNPQDPPPRGSRLPQ